MIKNITFIAPITLLVLALGIEALLPSKALEITRSKQAFWSKGSRLTARDTRTIEDLPEDMSFCIADIKYTGASLKIVEFGEGARSRFKGHAALFGQGSIWTFYWNYLAQFQVPVWLIGMPDDRELAAEMNLDYFAKIGGRLAPTVSVMSDNIHTEIKSRYGRVTDQHCKDYAGIVLIRKGRPLTSIKKLKEEFPSLIFVGQLSNKYVNNKYRTSLLFMTEELKKYRPACKSCSVVYDPKLSSNLIREFGCDIFVVKPINSSRGRGIMMVSKEELDETFKLILGDPEVLATSDLIEEFKYWVTYASPNFLVEQYEPSKPVFIEGKPYDATMRLVFTIDYRDNNVNVIVFDGYWKLPAQPLTANCSLTDKHKSHVIPGLLSSEKIDQVDMAHAKVMLENVLRQVYVRMLESRAMQLVDDFS